MTSLTPYRRTIHYYETDQMAIVHHSNYIRWLEEARLDFLQKLGIDIKALEERGILIPVVDVQCHYLHPVCFGDTVEIMPVITEYSGVRLHVQYEVRLLPSGTLAATATSCHCFMDKNHRPVSIRKREPALHNALSPFAKK